MRCINRKNCSIILLLIITIITFTITVSANSEFIYFKEALKLHNLGLYNGVSLTSFDPALGQKLTREAGITMLVRMFSDGGGAEAEKLSDYEVNKILAEFPDSDELSDWAVKPVAYAIKKKLIGGTTDGRLNPRAALLGKDYCTLILRALGYTVGAVDYHKAGELLTKKGGLSQPQALEFNNKKLVRDDFVGITFAAMNAVDINGTVTITKLVKSKIVNREKAVELGLYEGIEDVNNKVSEDKNNDDVVSFIDQNLETAVRDKIEKPEGDILISDVESITSFKANGKNISSLEGMENFKGLTCLKLFKNQIRDISPLKGLINLKELNLSSNNISEISPLSNLTNLSELQLIDNQINDISVLSNHKNLNILYLGSNNISDITPLNNLLFLNALGLGTNQITDISSLSRLLNLTYLDLYNNRISDINSLNDLTYLEVLHLNKNQIKDIFALNDLVNLTHLWLQKNLIENVTTLRNLKNLVILYLRDNQISDISALSVLNNLVELYLHGNQIEDYSPVKGYYDKLREKDFYFKVNFNDQNTKDPTLFDDNLIILSGNVLTPEGNCYIPGKNSWVNVCLRDKSGNDIAWADVDNNGGFRFQEEIPGGEYSLHAYVRGNKNPYVTAEPVIVQMIDGKNNIKNISLKKLVIKGHIYKPDGQYFVPGEKSSVNICLKTTDDSIIVSQDIEADSTYRLGGDIPTGNYVLYAYANGEQNPYLDAIPVPIHITEDQLFVKDISLVKDFGEFYLSAQSKKGVKFIAPFSGTYRFTVIKGAYENCPPEAAPEHPEWWGWWTFTFVLKNRPAGWNPDGTQKYDFVAGGRPKTKPTYEEGEEQGKGTYRDFNLQKGDYLIFIVNNPSDNKPGGIYFSIKKIRGKL